MTIDSGVQFDRSRALAIHAAKKGFANQQGKLLPVLDSLDMEIQRGEFVAILGPSGCGKSTLLNILAGVETLDGGQLEYDRWLEQDGHRRISVAWQEDSLMPWKRVHGNVEFPLIVRNVPATDRRQYVEKWISQVGLNGFGEYYPSQLSQGMRKRAALAAALVSEPRLLLMDEPFSALDLYTKQQMEKEVIRLWESLNATIVLVTHDVHEAVALADRIIILTARPARMKASRTIPLKRPRDLDTLYRAAEFHEIVREIWDVLSDESHEKTG
jgi:NitT/TauT family transport system ATP-binding protein